MRKKNGTANPKKKHTTKLKEIHRIKKTNKKYMQKKFNLNKTLFLKLKSNKTHAESKCNISILYI